MMHYFSYEVQCQLRLTQRQREKEVAKTRITSLAKNENAFNSQLTTSSIFKISNAII